MLQHGTMWLPPALGIFAQVVFGALWGMIGVLFAMPVVTVLMILIQVLYVQSRLGEDVPIVGDQNS